MNLRVIASGGTFDKHYDEIAGKLTFGDGHLAAAIARARITIPVVLEELPFLDSLEMQDFDRMVRVVVVVGQSDRGYGSQFRSCRNTAINVF